MKAVQLNGYGGKDVLKFGADVPEPAIEPGQVLVQVYAAAVNPFDWKVREGYMKDFMPLEFPAVLGGDLAGIVAKVGSDMTTLRVGDEVFGQANAVSGHGSYAEYAPVKAESLGPKPSKVDFATAAALPLAGVSAYQALVEHMKLAKGQKILIHGGAGGIASFAIQLAKHLGAYVASTAALNDGDYVKSLGADEVIDYESQDFSQLLDGYDAVFDTVGADTYRKSFTVLKRGGVIVSMVEEVDESLALEHDVKAIHQSTRVTTERLAKLSGLVDQGAIKVQIDKIFPLEDAPEALEYIKQGKQRGKVVLKVH